jgi:outer membrane protein OmpA-like peptidoglycan-associated protein
MHDHDRDAILARRALFISTALAGLACTTHEPPERPDLQPEQHAVAPNEVEEVEDNPVHEQPTDGARPSWSAIMAAAPPLDIPAGLTEREAELLSRVESRVRNKYAELEKVWTTLPVCAPSQAECEGWTASVQAINTTRPETGPLCDHSAETTNTVLERERAHDDYLKKISELLLADLDAAAKAHTAADVEAWNDFRWTLRRAQPSPCLRCAQPVAKAVTARVPFGDGQATLPADLMVHLLRRVVTIHITNGPARLIVRGHADPSEPDPDGLAQRRAEFVATELIGQGVGKAGLDVRSYGAKLLLTRDAAQAEQNRRVDFEVVPR